MLIEVSSPLTVRLPSGEVHLTPGQPMDLPDEQAKRLLKKVPSKVRAVSSPQPMTIEPAAAVEVPPVCSRQPDHLAGIWRQGERWCD